MYRRARIHYTYKGVTVVLQWCSTGVTVVLPWCSSGVTVTAVSRSRHRWDEEAGEITEKREHIDLSDYTHTQLTAHTIGTIGHREHHCNTTVTSL
jgi:hypothetical protein